MSEKSGAQISKKAFVQAVSVIFVLMMLAGILTRVIPAGQYARVEIDGRSVIDPTSFALVERPDYPIWRWFTAPFEVLAGPLAQPSTPGVRYRRWRTVAFDGCASLKVPDHDRNRRLGQFVQLQHLRRKRPMGNLLVGTAKGRIGARFRLAGGVGSRGRHSLV